MTKKFIILALLLFSRVSNSGSDMAMSFCANSRIELKELKSHILFLKSNEDKVFIENDCLHLKTLDTKEELFTRYIRQRLPLIKIKTSHELSQDRVCNLKIKKLISIKTTEDRLKNVKNNISARTVGKLNKFTEVLETNTYGDLFTSIAIANASFEISCKKNYNSGLFLIQIRTKSSKLSMKNTLSLTPDRWKRIGEYHVKGFSRTKKIAIINNEVHNSSKIELSLIHI